MNRDDWHRLKTDFQSLQTPWKTLVIISLDLALFAWSAKMGMTGSAGLAVVGSVLLTLVLLHTYLILHEASHSAICQKRWLNDLAGHLSGWLIALPYLSKQRSHLLHHKWAGHPKGDPANRRLIRRFSVMTKDEAQRLERVWHSWLPLLNINDRIGLWLDPFQKRRSGIISPRIDKEIHAAYFYWIGYALLFTLLLSTGTCLQFLKWYLPAFIGLQFLEEMANLPHHAETPLLNENDEALPYWQQEQVTHSCKTVPIWSRFFMLNFNLHTAHHLFPWVPWSGLPQVHRAISQKIPDLESEQQTTNELDWSMKNRKRPLLKIMGHYFDKIPKERAPESEGELALLQRESQVEEESDVK
jgi:fatty acid desaturase